MEQFLKEGERVNRLQNGFNCVNLPGVWSTIGEILMRYVTLEGCFCHFHAHLFLMLNQLRYDIEKKFSFWLLSSPEQFVRNIQAKCKKLSIHHGLIFHSCKFHYALLPFPATVCKNTTTTLDSTNPLGDPNPIVTIDELLWSFPHSTWAQGKSLVNDKTPSSPSNALPYQSPYPFRFLLLGWGSLRILMMRMNPRTWPRPTFLCTHFIMTIS